MKESLVIPSRSASTVGSPRPAVRLTPQILTRTIGSLQTPGLQHCILYDDTNVLFSALHYMLEMYSQCLRGSQTLDTE